MSRRRRRPSDTEVETPPGPVQWRRMVGYLGPYKARLALAFLALVISAALSLVFPAVIRDVVDSVLVQGNLALLNQITVLLLAVFFIRSISSLLETYNLNFVGERVVVDLRKALYEHVQGLSLHFFTERRVGELVSRLSNDVTVMRTAMTSNVIKSRLDKYTSMWSPGETRGGLSAPHTHSCWLG